MKKEELVPDMTKRDKEDEPAKMGAPTKYKPEYPKMLVEHMSQGYSYHSFAGLVRVDSDTLHNWEKTHLDFFGAKKEGLELNRMWWEKVAIREMNGTNEGRPINPTLYIFNMKNRFPKEWRDKQDHEITGKDGEALQPAQIVITIPGNGSESKD